MGKILTNHKEVSSAAQYTLLQLLGIFGNRLEYTFFPLTTSGCRGLPTGL